MPQTSLRSSRSAAFGCALGALTLGGVTLDAVRPDVIVDVRVAEACTAPKAVDAVVEGDLFAHLSDPVFLTRPPQAVAEAVPVQRSPRDPFAQLELAGIDGAALKTSAKAMGLDVHAVADFDLSLVDRTELNAADRTCLTQAIYYEARNQSVIGQKAVADVVLNRVASKRYPNTVCGVVYQGSHLPTGCQFSFTCDGSMRYRVERRAMARAEVLATAVLAGFRLDVARGATHYHANYVDPYWAPTLDVTARVGDHIFYKRGRNFRLALAEGRI